MEKKTKDMCTVPDSVLATLQKDIAEIKVALLGNEYNPEGGLLCRTTELERDFEKLKAKYEKTMAYAMGAAAGVSIVISITEFILVQWVFKQ